MSKFLLFIKEKQNWFFSTIIVLFILQILGAVIAYLFRDNGPTITLYHLGAAFIYTTTFFFLRQGKHDEAINICIWGSFLLNSIFIIFTAQSIAIINAIVYFLILMFASTFSRFRTMVYLAIGSIVIIWAIYLAEQLNLAHPIQPTHLADNVYISFLMILTVWLHRFNLDKAEQETSIAQNEYQRIFENLPIGIYRSSPEGKQLRGNPALAALNGYKNEAALLNGVKDINTEWYVDENRRGEFKAILEREGRLENFESEVYRHNTRERIWISESAYIIKDSDGKTLYYEGSVQDITYRKQAEETLNHVQRLDSLGVLAGGIAHDFNNLLLAMLGQISVANYKLPDNSPAATHLNKAKKAAEEAAVLCNQLLVYSGKGHFEIQAVSLNQLINNYLHMFRVVVPNSIQFQTRLDNTLPPIQADPTQIQQIIINLILNASEAISHESGVLILRSGQEAWEQIQNSQNDFSILPSIMQDYAYIEVEDNGCGIAKDTMTSIFEPFFSTKSYGHGLGLSAVIGILRSHNGGIAVNSTLGSGTRIKLFFPLSNESITKLAENNEIQDEQIAFPSKTALVIDDQEEARHSVRDILELYGHAVIEAQNGFDGIRLFESNKTSIDIIILDLIMPELSGEETFAQLRKLDGSIPIIFSSGFTQSKAVYELIKASNTGFIKKPYSAPELQTLVSNLLQNKL